MTEEHVENWLIEWVAAHQGLSTDAVSVEENIFDAGYVDSLGVYRLLFELCQHFDLNCDIDLLLTEAAPTLRAIAKGVTGD